jgi:hypothetical protein
MLAQQAEHAFSGFPCCRSAPANTVEPFWRGSRCKEGRVFEHRRRRREVSLTATPKGRRLNAFSAYAEHVGCSLHRKNFDERGWIAL